MKNKQIYGTIVTICFILFAIALFYLLYPHQQSASSKTTTTASPIGSYVNLSAVLGSGFTLNSGWEYGAISRSAARQTDALYHFDINVSDISGFRNITHTGVNYTHIFLFESNLSGSDYIDSIKQFEDAKPNTVSVYNFTHSGYIFTDIMLSNTGYAHNYPSLIVGSSGNYLIIADVSLTIPYGQSYNSIVSKILDYAISNTH